MLKMLKALAATKDMTLGELLEGMVLHAFEGKVPFGNETLAHIARLRDVYELDLTAADAHRLRESDTI